MPYLAGAKTRGARIARGNVTSLAIYIILDLLQSCQSITSLLQKYYSWSRLLEPNPNASSKEVLVALCFFLNNHCQIHSHQDLSFWHCWLWEWCKSLWYHGTLVAVSLPMKRSPMTQSYLIVWWYQTNCIVTMTSMWIPRSSEGTLGSERSVPAGRTYLYACQTSCIQPKKPGTMTSDYQEFGSAGAPFKLRRVCTSHTQKKSHK